MIAENETFSGKRIYLDGCSFTNCTFDKCTIVYSGVLGMELNNPKFSNCVWEVQGASKETLQFLSGIYKAGAVELVEATFRNIRGEPPEGTPLQ